MKHTWLPILALLALLAAGLALDVALQHRPAADLDVGGADLGYVDGFSAKEWSDSLPGPNGPVAGTYRWMGARGTLLLGPVQPGQPAALVLRMFSGRPAGSPPPEVHLAVNGQPWPAFTLGAAFREYSILIPAEVMRGEMVQVELETETFQAPGDARELGLVMESARLQTAAGAPFSLRGVAPTYALAGLAVALGALALGLSLWLSWGLGAAFLALAGAGLLVRPELVLHAGPTVAVLLILAALSAGAVRLLGPRWNSLSRWLGEHAESVLVILFILGMLLSFFPHVESDGIEYYAYLRSLAFDGDLHFANELSLDTPFPHVPYGLGQKQTVTGYEPNFASVGPAIVWAPFFAVGHLLALGGHALGLSWSLDGYSEPYVVAISFGSTLSALVTLLLGYDLLRRLYGKSLSLLATAATFAGTTALYYAFYKADFAHALAACAVTVFVYLWFRTLGNRTLLQWLWLGLAAGAMTTMYWIDAIFCLLPALELGWEGVGVVFGGRRLEDRAATSVRERPISRNSEGGKPSRDRSLGGDIKYRAKAGAAQGATWPALGHLVLGGAVFLGGFLVAFFPQMLAWKVIFGQWFTVPQEGFATPSGLALKELLLSPLHGLLPWTPLAVLGMAGLFILAWKKRPWGIFVLVTFLAYFIYNATLYSWHGGGTFGLRRLTNAFPFFLLGVAALLQWLRRWRPAAAMAAAVVPTFWGLMVLWRYLAYTIPHYPAELESLSLGEFLFAPGNFPLNHLLDALKLSFLVQWLVRLGNNFRWADLVYGVVVAALIAGAIVGVRKLLRAAPRSGPPPTPGTAAPPA